jgi:hypothetical protein
MFDGLLRKASDPIVLLLADVADVSLHTFFCCSVRLAVFDLVALLMFERFATKPFFFFRCLIRFLAVLLQSTASSQYPPFPFSFLSRATLEKKKLSDRLCRIEF